MAKPNRRVAEFRTKKLLAKKPGISNQSVDTIITEVGITVEADKRELLRVELSDIFTWGEIFNTALNEQPAIWEVRERLNTIRASANSIWTKLGITKAHTDAWTGNGILSGDINAAMWPPLRHAAEAWGRQHEPKRFEENEVPDSAPIFKTLGPFNFYAGNRIRDVVYGVAALIAWADIALTQIANVEAPPPAKHRPDHTKLLITCALAEIYLAVYERKPKQTRQGHWLKFLRTSLSEGGFGEIGDEAARKLWQRASALRRARNLG